MSEFAEGGTKYAEAKVRYLQCSRGQVYIIDFSSVSLLQSANKKSVRIGVQSCSSATPSKWYTDDFKVNVTVSGGLPKIIFLNISYDSDRIETWDFGTGLSNQGFF